MKTAYLSLGTNVGDKLQNLNAAVRQLRQANGIDVAKISGVYETAPVGYEDQDIFYNIALEIKTSLSPNELLETCLGIEAELGRVRLFKWGPRLIDIDILLYEDLKINTETLKIPHPYMKERAFVMLPLQEIANSVAQNYLQEALIKDQEVKLTHFKIEG
ncbi:2-amino-4-hydroxy-6-hydroxymethyldihydropteridine pyrophosphokinase [Listeria floridensis FSL S10-1187]|uniref:2-amino-4-hydroxy-6-hydroxymethyldihydropteridine diphosphokinase n=1 Tax=Listeria floridensis FSL S10-1187 TaxID=1265817 RepID=A0ABN0RD58_9LIST|nr:2-amino-4-hydroxy-6-hydroxymethyldihydropteridine diphosphokinase [Listeria floridensis]EUJ28794.1 2-amino-4-hydroxy-6-hydroxymethyldihydropteridine pyrophosphokinase [Listeria floridensis FSL S10-1187]